MLLRKRVALSYAIPIALAALMVALSFLLVRGTTGSAEAEVHRGVELLVRAERLEAVSARVSAAGRGFLVTRQDDLLEQVRRGRDDFQRLIAVLATSPEDRELLDEVAAAAARYDARFDAAIQARGGEGIEEAAKIFEAEVLPERRALDNAMAAYIAHRRLRLDEAQAEAVRRQWQTTSLAIVVAAIGLLSIAGLGVSLTRGIAQTNEDRRVAV